MLEYEAAVAAVDAMRAREGPALNQLCRTRLLGHGRRTQRSIVLFHGITNCPQQFDALGGRLHEAGYNVLLPRYPHHGLADRMSTDIGRLTVADLTGLAGEAADIGSGLGERVTVAGLSLGGVVCAWLAQQRPVDLAVLISPLFAIRRLPVGLTRTLGLAARVLPDRYFWWDPRLRESLPPPYGYPRCSTRAFGTMLSLGRDVQGAARRRPPRAGAVVAVTNAHDPGLNNHATERLVETWRRRWGETVLTHEFPDSARLPHDLIDPSHPEQQVDLVYPVLLDLLARPLSSGGRSA